MRSQRKSILPILILLNIKIGLIAFKHPGQHLSSTDCLFHAISPYCNAFIHNQSLSAVSVALPRYIVPGKKNDIHKDVDKDSIVLLLNLIV